MAICPKCGSVRFEYKLRSGGADVSSTYYRKLNRQRSSWFIPAGQKNISINRRNITIGFCPDCGYMQELQPPKKRMPVGCSTAIVLFFVICIVSGIINSGSDKNTERYIWAHEVTPIEQFEYVIDGNEIHLEKYIGKPKEVYIGLEYEIDGEMMSVVEIECNLRNVTSCIIPDGARQIKNSMFNGSSVKYLYLPASLEVFKGWSYFHNLDYLYYGGSEEEFKKIHGGDASRLVSKRIFYNASITDIIEQDLKEHSTVEENTTTLPETTMIK